MKKFISTLVFSVSLLSAPAVLADMVNINTASAAVLQENLKGIGEKKAGAIVAYRKEHGDFKTLEELTEVKGIGDGILSKNKADLSLDEGIVELTGKAADEVSAKPVTPATPTPAAKIEKSEEVKKDKAVIES